MKKTYYYLFYKLYKLWEYFPSTRFLCDMKAVVIIGGIEISILLSILNYYNVLTKTVTILSLAMPIVYIPLLIILGVNYFFFLYSDSWKEYFKEFDQLPKKKNMIGSWIVAGSITFVVANLIYSFYLMSQIDWSQYR